MVSFVTLSPNVTRKIYLSNCNKPSSSDHHFRSNTSFEADPHFEIMVWAALSLNPELAELMWKGMCSTSAYLPRSESQLFEIITIPCFLYKPNHVNLLTKWLTTRYGQNLLIKSLCRSSLLLTFWVLCLTHVQFDRISTLTVEPPTWTCCSKPSDSSQTPHFRYTGAYSGSSSSANVDTQAEQSWQGYTAQLWTWASTTTVSEVRRTVRQSPWHVSFPKHSDLIFIPWNSWTSSFWQNLAVTLFQQINGSWPSFRNLCLLVLT